MKYREKHQKWHVKIHGWMTTWLYSKCCGCCTNYSPKMKKLPDIYRYTSTISIPSIIGPNPWAIVQGSARADRSPRVRPPSKARPSDTILLKMNWDDTLRCAHVILNAVRRSAHSVAPPPQTQQSLCGFPPRTVLDQIVLWEQQTSDACC